MRMWVRLKTSMAETTHPGEAPPACPSLRFAHRGAKKLFLFPQPSLRHSRREGGPAQRRPGESSPTFKATPPPPHFMTIKLYNIYVFSRIYYTFASLNSSLI